MRDEITDLYYSPEPLCVQGREFLIDRELQPLAAAKAGICSKGGMIYFLFFRNGKPVRWKARSMTDKKVQFMSKLEDADQPGFKMPFFSHFKGAPSKDLIITEGEFDCVALSQLGGCNCVSLPNGSGSVESAFKNNYEFLQQYERIFIAFDMDEPGQEAAKKAMALLPASKYRRINFPCKDANEWLIKNPSADLEDLEDLMRNASNIQSPYLTHLSDLPRSYYETVDVGVSTGWEKLDGLLGGVRTKEVTVITADTGSGKSTFCVNFIKNVADQGKGVWVNSFEMNPSTINRKIAGMVLEKKMKYESFFDDDVKKYHEWTERVNFRINILNHKMDINSLRKIVELAVFVYGIKYIVLDHLDYIYSSNKKNSSLEELDEVIREIHLIAMEFDVGIILVAHPKQITEKREITMNDIKGSSSIKQYADNIIIITRMNRFDPEDPLRVKVRVTKNRLLGQEGFIYLRYIEGNDGYTENF